MHRSRLCAVVIDCEGEDLERASRFWSAALGRPEVEREGKYVGLRDRTGEPMVLVQAVDHPSRVHLDIESDDVEAEVARLEALGAKRVAKVKTWQVLEAPTGHRFCVVRPQRGTISEHASVWDGPERPRSTDDAVRATLEALTSAWRERRFADLDPLFEEGVIFALPDGRRIAGRSACVATYRDFVEAVEITAYRERDLTIDRPNPHTAMASYAWDMTWVRDAVPHQESGRDLLTLRQTGGVWRILWRTMLPGSS